VTEGDTILVTEKKESVTGKTQPAPEQILMAQNRAPETGTSSQDQEDETEAEEEVRDLGRLMVTGTRLDSAPAGSPVYTLDRAEMDRRGLNSIAEVLRYLPQNYSQITKGGTYDNQSPRFSAGAVTASLRGLGEGSTLVLVNGKRIAASPAESGTYTDISTIPFSAIERIEVLNDGGSAIYGSDAVAGVVNIILRKDYRGSESRVRYEDSSGGGDRFQFDQTLGIMWSTGGLTASFNYQKEDPTIGAKSGVSLSNDFREQGGRAFPATESAPGLILRFSGFPPNAPPGTRVGILPPGDGSNIDPDDIIYVTAQEFLTQTGNFNLLDFSNSRAYQWLTPKSEQLSAYLDFDQDIGSSLRLNVSGIWSESESDMENVSSFYSHNVPASNYYNTLGIPLHIAYNFENEVATGQLPPMGSHNEASRYNVFTSLEWQTPFKDWSGELAYSFGEDETWFISTNGFIPSAMDAALASPDPATALNFFGDGSVQRGNLEELLQDRDYGTRVGKQDVLSLSFNGTLFETDGGAWQMAIGAEQRTDELDFGDFILDPFTSIIPDAPEIVPKSDNKAYYIEFAVPLVSRDNARTGLHGLAFQLAYRWDDYEIRGPFEGITEPFSKRTFDDSVPKIGVSWYPIADLQIRATWGETFQAPTLPELFSPQRCFNAPCTANFYPVFDPFNPESNGGPFFPVFPLALFGGNAELQPQTSETTTFGFDWSPAGVPGLRFSATYNKIEFEDIISTLQSLGSPPVYALENPELFPGLIERNDEGVLTFMNLGSANLAAYNSETLDLFGQYSFNSDVGIWTLGAAATYTMKLEWVAAPGTEGIRHEGTTSGPSEWRGNTFLDWSLGNWSANATLLYTSSYKNIHQDAIQTNIDSYTTLDVQGTYDWIGTGWRFTAGVKNLLEEEFPFVDIQGGVDSSKVDFRGRIFYLDFVKEFQW
jgi:outer membrane receptor protein involved in Fe transport